MIAWKLDIDLADARRVPEGFRSVEVEGECPDYWTPQDLRRSAALFYGLPIERIPEPTLWGRA